LVSLPASRQAQQVVSAKRGRLVHVDSQKIEKSLVGQSVNAIMAGAASYEN
jgi:hypothetical protein